MCLLKFDEECEINKLLVAPFPRRVCACPLHGSQRRKRDGAGVGVLVASHRGTVPRRPGPLINDFKQAGDPSSSLARNGIAPTYPGTFAADIRANRLPAVSWVLPGFQYSEHPSLPVADGAAAIVDVLRPVRNPAASADSKPAFHPMLSTRLTTRVVAENFHWHSTT